MNQMKSKVIKIASSIAMGSSMMIMSMLPAASAFAQTAPSITLSEQGYTMAAQVSPGASVTFHAAANGITAPMYQFWVEQPNGTWTNAQNYSSNSTFTLNNVASGDYLVTAYVLSDAQLKAGDYGAATNLNTVGQQNVDGVFVDSSVKLSESSAQLVAGKPVTLTAAASNIYNPLYQFWYETPSGQWMQSGNYQSSNTFTLTPSVSGTYKFIAYAKSPLALNDPQGALFSNSSTATVLPVVQVGLTDSLATLPNNGTAADTFTAAVTDPNGNPVSGVTVTFTSSNSGVVAFASGAVAATATTAANGVATVTGTAGITVGTAVVTAVADMQASAPVTITTTQGAAASITGATVSPNVGVGYYTSGPAIPVGTAGTSETISAEIVDAQGNPVPNQQIVLQGNHVDTNSLVSPYRQNSVELPSATTFTPFSSQNFGFATSTASGMVTFTVENAANSSSGVMSVAAGNTANFTSGSTTYALPYNTYTFEAVPASTTVTEGTALPSAVTANAIGTENIAWFPNSAPAMALAIEPLSTGLPTDYTTQDSATSVGVTNSATFDVAPYFSNIAPTVTNPNGSLGNTAIPFGVGTFGEAEPNQALTYNLSTNGNGVISSVFGASLSGTGNGWTYDPASQMWSDLSGGGANYESADVQVAISYQEVNNAPVYTVSVTTPTESTPLTLTSALTPSGIAVPGVPDFGQNTALQFTTSNGIAQTDAVNVTASFDNLWEGAYGSASLVAGTQTVTAASATVAYSVAVSASTATFNPAYVTTATSLNNAPMSETITVLNASGDVVPNYEVAIDGAGANGYSGYYNNASSTGNNALWVTKVDGSPLLANNALDNGTLPDAFPLVDPGSLGGTYYVAPNPIAGTVSFANSTLDAYTNAEGQVTLTLQGGGANYVSANNFNAQQASDNVTGNTYYVGVWNSGSFLNSMTIGNGAPVSAVIPVSVTTGTATVSTNSVSAGSPVTITGVVSGYVGSSQTATVLSGITVTGTVDNVSSTTVTNANGTYTLTVAPTSATATGDVTVTAGGVAQSPTITAVTVLSDVTSAPTSVTVSGIVDGFNLEWNSVASATSYTVLEENVTTGSSFTSVVTTSNTVASVSGLTAGDTYQFEVEGVDKYGNVGSPSTPTSGVEYGLNMVSTSGVSSSFVAVSGTTSGSASVTVTFDNPVSGVTTGDFTVYDSTVGTYLTVTKATPSGDVVTLALTIPDTDPTVASTDSYTVTITQGAATNSAGQPAAANKAGNTAL